MPPRFKEGKPLFTDGKPSFCDPCCPSECPPLTADFDWTNEGNYYFFTDQSETEEPAEIISWHWDFGDGNESDEQNPSHLYEDAETYTICLTVCTSGGEGTEPVCCQTICKTPCEEGNQTFTGCSDVEDCLSVMRPFLHLELIDNPDDGPCNLAGQSGIYPLDPVPPGSFLSDLYNKFAMNGCGSYLIPCASTGFGHNLDIDCVDGELVISSNWNGQCLPGEGGWLSWFAGASFPMPITVTSGMIFDLGAITSSTGITGNIKVQFVGRPCEPYDNEDPPPENCEDAATGSFTWSNPFGMSRSCYQELNITIVPGVCPVDYCFWSDGNTEGCSRTGVGIGNGCGEHTKDLTLYVVDRRGCVTSFTDTLACCSCDDGDGNNCEPTNVSISVSVFEITDFYEAPGSDACGSRYVFITDYFVEITCDGDGEDSCGYSYGVELTCPHIPGGSMIVSCPFSFYLTDIQEYYAPSWCITATSFNVATDPTVTPPAGCQGPTTCWQVSNVDFYPGNWCWYDHTDCSRIPGTLATNCCPDNEGCGEDPNPSPSPDPF